MGDVFDCTNPIPKRKSTVPYLVGRVKKIYFPPINAAIACSCLIVVTEPISPTAALIVLLTPLKLTKILTMANNI